MRKVLVLVMTGGCMTFVAMLVIGHTMMRLGMDRPPPTWLCVAGPALFFVAIATIFIGVRRGSLLEIGLPGHAQRPTGFLWGGLSAAAGSSMFFAALLWATSTSAHRQESYGPWILGAIGGVGVLVAMFLLAADLHRFRTMRQQAQGQSQEPGKPGA